MSEKHIGSSIDDFPKEEGIFEEAQAQAVKEVVAWQLAQVMKEKKIGGHGGAARLNRARLAIPAIASGKPMIDVLRSVTRLKRGADKRMIQHIAGYVYRKTRKALQPSVLLRTTDPEARSSPIATSLRGVERLQTLTRNRYTVRYIAIHSLAGLLHFPLQSAFFGLLLTCAYSCNLLI